MKPILAIVHIYYVEMWEELKNCLKNIEPNPYDLYVTIVKANETLVKDILQFKPDTKIEIVENRGYDIAPFIHIINQVDLDNYEYLIKLHTKTNLSSDVFINGFKLRGDLWRKYLLDFIATKENFKNTLKLLDTNNIGMITNYRLILGNRGYDKLAEKKLENLLKEKKFPKLDFKFVAGTMFIAKANTFKPLQKLFSLSNFEDNFNGKGQLAHLVERFLGYLVYYNKQEIYSTSIQKRKILYARILHFLYQYKTSDSGKRLMKICKIPVYRKKLKNN